MINRCRLISVLDADIALSLGEKTVDCLSAMAAAGDISSLILSPGTLEEDAFEAVARPLVPIAQAANIAVIIAGYTRTAGRLKADGLQFGQNAEAIYEAVEKYAPKQIVGAANVKSRHSALMIGEAGADYVMFGKPGGDTHAQANPKNLGLAQWWAAMVETPGVVMGGTDVESVIEVAQTGCDFVALGAAIFTPDCSADSCAAAVARANELLETHAPRFQDPA